MEATKRDLQKAIWEKCQICANGNFGGNVKVCQAKSCPLWPYRSPDAPKQIDIFRVSDKDIFMNRILEVANSYGLEPFFWSQLRKDVNMRPLHDNWWGVSTRVLQKNGFRIIDGTRRSTHKSRCGAMDRRWMKAYLV